MEMFIKSFPDLVSMTIDLSWADFYPNLLDLHAKIVQRVLWHDEIVPNKKKNWHLSFIFFRRHYQKRDFFYLIGSISVQK